MNTVSRTGSLIRDSSPTQFDGFDSLAELAPDMRSSWDRATDTVWRQLDPVLWELTHNPSSHEFQVHVRESGFTWIAERRETP